MSKMAKEIVVEQRGGMGGPTALFIDGQEFPWHYMRTVEASVGQGEASTLTISIPAERVSIVPVPE